MRIEYEEEPQIADAKSEENPRSPVLKKDKWQPPFWKQQLLNIYEMRRCRDAPVDTMGCDRISDRKAEPKVHNEVRSKDNVLV